MSNPTSDTPKDTTINDFLAEVSNAARELSNTIRGSVTKAMGSSKSGSIPLLDMFETEDAVVIRTAPLDSDAPPVIEVSMTGDTLMLKITTYGSEDASEESYLLRERRFGEFVRTIQIPRAVRAQAAQARLKNRELLIVLPKMQDEGPSIISVQTAD